MERLATADAPTAELEHWRYSPVGDLDVSAYHLAPDAPMAPVDVTLPAPARALLDRIEDRAGVVVVRNGRLASVDLDAAASAAGVTVGSASEPLALADVPDHDALDDLHDAFVPEVVVVHVPAGVVVEGPLVVVQLVEGGGVASFAHVVVDTGVQSELTVVDHSTDDGSTALSVPVVELHAGDASNLRYVAVQTLTRDVWQLGRLAVTAGRDATVRAWVMAMGGDYARVYVSAELPAQGSTVEIAGVYFGDGDQTLDFRSLQDHIAPRSRSNFLLKGAVVDRAHGAYTGLIRVREGAKRTDSFLTNRNLVLSEGAGVDSVPNLEIVNENDLASCGHASATGPVDEEHRFYLESRGVPTHVAERLIVYGFFDEVLAGVPVEGARDALREVVADKLGRAHA